MPDIQTAFRTALSKTLQQWDDEVTKQPLQPVSITTPTPSEQQPAMTKKTFTITNNISRVTFEFIKDNPGSTRKELITALEHQGFRPDSVSSLIAQMRRNNMIHSTNDLYYADIPEYRPIKSLKATKKAEQAQPSSKLGALLKQKLSANNSDAGIAALHADAVEAPQAKRFVSLVRTKTPQDVLKDMTVYQARELYVHLREMFGG